MNQSDLSSWMLAGSYVVKAQTCRTAISSGCCTACSATRAATPPRCGTLDTARNVGSVFAYDEWQVSRTSP